MPLLVAQRSSLGVVSDQLSQFEKPLNFTMSSFKTTPKNSLYRQLYGSDMEESSPYDKQQPEEQGNNNFFLHKFIAWHLTSSFILIYL